MRCRYFPLLGKSRLENTDATPLQSVFNLLVAKATRPSVTVVIMQLVESLIDAEPFEPTDDVAEIRCGTTVDLSEFSSGKYRHGLESRSRMQLLM